MSGKEGVPLPGCGRLREFSALFGRRFGGGGSSLVLLPGEQKQQRHAGADGAIGDVEGGEADFSAATPAEVKVNEIHDVAVPETVHQVAGDTAENQPERKLTEQRLRIEVVPAQKQHQQSDEGEDGEQLVAAGELIEQAPCRAGVAPVNELEKAFDDHLLLCVAEVFQHGQFRELIEQEHCRGHDGHSSGRAKFHVVSAIFCLTPRSNASLAERGWWYTSTRTRSLPPLFFLNQTAPTE